MNSYGREFLESVLALKNLKVNETPNFITMKALYDGLHARGLNLIDAGRLAGCVKIDVNSNFVNDKELFDPIINGYVDFLYEAYVETTAINTTLFWTSMTQGGLVLQYSLGA